MDTSPRYKNDNQTGQFGNQMTIIVAGARETVGTQETKRVKDYTYHKEKMLMCKQAEKGVPLQVEQADWLENTDGEIDEQELEAHYGFMAHIQEVLPPELMSNVEPLEQVQYDAEYNMFANVRQHSEKPESISNTYVVEKVDSNVIPDSSDICDNDIQTDQNAEDERAAFANLIANLTLDTEENKKILNFLIAVQCKQTELEKYMAFNDHTVDYEKLEHKLNETLGLLAQKEIDIKEGLKLKAYEISVVKEKQDELVKQSLLTKSHYESLVKEKTKIPSDTYDLENRFTPDKEETLTLEKESRSKLDKDLVKLYDYTKQNSLYENFKLATQEYHEQLAHANEYVESLKKEIDELESDKAEFSNMYDILLQECIVHFGNDQFAPVLGYRDLAQENVTINRVYYVEGHDGQSKAADEAPKVLKDFLKMIQQNLQASVNYVRTDKGTKFLNKTLHRYFKEEGIEHKTSTPRTPK
ncbi:integrase, catalytic region, zinc finger, CCHC-type containing protein [Tanacetum coccineum]